MRIFWRGVLNTIYSTSCWSTSASGICFRDFLHMHKLRFGRDIFKGKFSSGQFFGEKMSSFRWNLKSEIWDLRAQIWDLRADIWELRSEIWDLRSESSDLRSESWDLRAEIWDLRAEIWDLGGLPSDRIKASKAIHKFQRARRPTALYTLTPDRPLAASYWYIICEN